MTSSQREINIETLLQLPRLGADKWWFNEMIVPAKGGASVRVRVNSPIDVTYFYPNKGSLKTMDAVVEQMVARGVFPEHWITILDQLGPTPDSLTKRSSRRCIRWGTLLWILWHRELLLRAQSITKEFRTIYSGHAFGKADPELFPLRLGWRGFPGHAKMYPSLRMWRVQGLRDLSGWDGCAAALKPHVDALFEDRFILRWFHMGVQPTLVLVMPVIVGKATTAVFNFEGCASAYSDEAKDRLMSAGVLPA